MHISTNANIALFLEEFALNVKCSRSADSSLLKDDYMQSYDLCKTVKIMKWMIFIDLNTPTNFRYNLKMLLLFIRSPQHTILNTSN